MTALARQNGWRGFGNLGDRVEGGTEYRCDGMPTMTGCGASVVVSRRWSKVGTKLSGWLVMYGECFPDETADDAEGHDLDVVLTFCPSCAAVVTAQQGAERVQGDRQRGERMTNDYNDPFEQVGDVPVFDWNAAAARRKERDAEREAASLAAHQAVVREAVERVQGEAGEGAE